MADELTLLNAELARREMARRWYADYLPFVHGKNWKTTRMSQYLASEVQAFLEADTGNAYDILVIQTPPQHGKLCADDTPVPTPAGWKRHGDLKPGDLVFGPGGKPIRVLAEIPQTEPASLRVTFTDGSQIDVHPNHEWTVKDKNTKAGLKTYETHKMRELGLRLGPEGRGGRYRFSVPHNPVIEYPEAEQTLHPYFLGLWLGDGSTTKPCISHSPSDTAPIERLLELGYPVSTENIHGTTGVVTTYFYGRGYSELKDLDFGHTHGQRKRIPDRYKFASVEQRLQLLAGMIDSDGYVYQKNGRVTISNINKELIDDFTEVVRSLGWRATVCEYDPVESTSGVVAKHKCYQLGFNPDTDIPVQLPRKKLTNIRPQRRCRGIVSIEPCEPRPGKCITVEGGLYLVGEHFTPTHNSMTLTETLPSWVMGKFPEWRIILGSYNDESADRFARRNKEKVVAFGKTLFGVEIGQINRATEFELAGHLGRLISRGIMSGVTGNPANLMIIDDPIKNRQESDSPTYRRKLWDEWQNSFKSRLAAHAKVIVIATPWHEDDMMANLLKTEDNIRLIRLPVEAEENDPLGRVVGDSLCPELGKDNKWLDQFKSSYLAAAEGGRRAWTALYQCSPRVEGGNLVKREWWKYYTPEEAPAFATEVISVDAAFKGADNNDFVAITVWGKAGNDYYLRYCLNRHLDFTGTLDAIRQVRQLYPNARTVLIEDKANGSAIINVLQKEMFCVPVNPKGGKVARVNAVSAAIESGHVFVPADAPWLGEYLDQWSAFPAGAHDDMCFVAGTSIATAFGDKPIEEVKPGDRVWTPFGLRKVTRAWMTGEKPVIDRMGLTGTPDHPIFEYDLGYVPLKRLTPTIHFDTLSLKGVIRWKYQKLLYLTAWNTGSWDPVDITSVSRVAMKDDDTLKDFMWRFGSFIRGRQFRKAMRFTTRTAILLTTTLATWSVYRAANTARCGKQKIQRSSESIWKEFVHFLRRGTALLKVWSGTENTLKRASENGRRSSMCVSSAGKSLNQPVQPPSDFARTTAPLSGTTETSAPRKHELASSVGRGLRRWSAPGVRKLWRRAAGLAPENCEPSEKGTGPIMVRASVAPVKSAETSLKRSEPTPSRMDGPIVPKPVRREAAQKSAEVPVYNLTVEGNHLYYAGGFLVHNCDSSSQALSYMLYSTGYSASLSVDQRAAAEQELLEQEKESFLDGSVYDVYGTSMDIY